MTDVADMTPGQVLAEASVADFIGAMGLAIARAQTALDENTVNQIPVFAEKRDGLGGRSLFDLGLSPAFYHYQHADLSVSLQLSLRVQREIGFDLGLHGDFNDGGTGETDEARSETETESGSSTRTENRSAEISIQSTSEGALTVGGTAYPLPANTGSPAARIGTLAETLRAAPASGIERALVRPATPGPVNPVCQPPSDQIVCSPNAVAFYNGVGSLGVIRISQVPAADETFTLRTGISTTVTPQGTVLAQASETTTRIIALNFNARRYSPGDVIDTVYFDWDRTDLDQQQPVQGPGATEPNRTKLQRLAAWLRGSGARISLEGTADRSGPQSYNTPLSVERQQVVSRELARLGVPASQLNLLTSRGEDRWSSTPDGVRDPVKRIVEIKLEGQDHYIVVTPGSAGDLDPAVITPDRRPPGGPPGNGFVYVGANASNAQLSVGNRVIVINGTSVPVRGAQVAPFATHAPESYAANLATDVNSNPALTGQVRAWATGNVCHLANLGDSYSLTLLTTETRDIRLSGSTGITVTSQFSRERSSRSASRTTSNRAVAFGGTANFRFGRQFEQNITGNSTISARLVAIPAPPEFLDEIKAYLAE